MEVFFIELICPKIVNAGRYLFIVKVHNPWGFLQKDQQRYAFHDHNQVVEQISSPFWWKSAYRPLDCAQMRKPAYSPVD